MSLAHVVQWWKCFKQRHIADYDHRLWGDSERMPYAATILPHVEPRPRVSPEPCFRPEGTWRRAAATPRGFLIEPHVMGWQVRGQNDRARIEVLLAWLSDFSQRSTR